MTSKRVFAGAIVVAAALFAGELAQTAMFQFGGITPKEERAGPVRLLSPAFVVPGDAKPLPAGWDGQGRAALYDWKDREMQELLGTVRTVVLWSSETQRKWVRPGSACDFIIESFGRSDGVTAMPGADALSEPYKRIHTCNAVSLAEQRTVTYAFNLPDPRCSTSALIFWKIPGDAGMQARTRAMQAVRSAIAPDAACIETARSIALTFVTVCAAGVVSVLLLLVILFRRSA